MLVRYGRSRCKVEVEQHAASDASHLAFASAWTLCAAVCLTTFFSLFLVDLREVVISDGDAKENVSARIQVTCPLHHRFLVSIHCW
jgi:hypothetical protein